MKITIIAVGKIKEDYYRQAIGEYCKRLGKFCSLEIIEVADEKTPDCASDLENAAIRKKEGDRIAKAIKGNPYIIATAIEGKELDSPALSKKLESIMNINSHIVFIIGGSLGLADEIKGKADFMLSFSPMTFPHQLMRVILLEQVYRAFKISAGEPYHK